MILCVNPNAAVDKTLVIDHFSPNALYRPSFELTLPGGKGCNVARVAKALGQEAVVTGWVGGHGGQLIEEGLRTEGIQTAFVHTPVESRTCVAVLDPSNGTLTEINEKGRPVTLEALEAFFTLFQEWLPKVELVTLSGSLPPGVPADFYAKLARMAAAAGVQAVLDSSGEPLRLGAEAGQPAVIKCNRAELSALAGRTLSSLEDIRHMIREYACRLGVWVIITLGGSGAIAAAPGPEGARTWLAQAPGVAVVSAVGSGDAFLAGLACAMLADQPIEEALRQAIAAGSANALQIGAGLLRPADVEMLLDQVLVAEEK